MKRITLGFVAFLLTFGVSTTLVGLIFGFQPPIQLRSSYDVRNLSSDAMAIKKVIETDVSNGTSRRIAERRLLSRWNSSETQLGRIERLREHAAVVDRYAKASSSINVGNTPSEFRRAWNIHMAAWQKQAMYRKAMSKGFDNYSDNTVEINRTWKVVLNIAEEFDVPMQRRYWR